MFGDGRSLAALGRLDNGGERGLGIPQTQRFHDRFRCGYGSHIGSMRDCRKRSNAPVHSDASVRRTLLVFPAKEGVRKSCSLWRGCGASYLPAAACL